MQCQPRVDNKFALAAVVTLPQHKHRNKESGNREGRKNCNIGNINLGTDQSGGSTAPTHPHNASVRSLDGTRKQIDFGVLLAQFGEFGKRILRPQTTAKYDAIGFF